MILFDIRRNTKNLHKLDDFFEFKKILFTYKNVCLLSNIKKKQNNYFLRRKNCVIFRQNQFHNI